MHTYHDRGSGDDWGNTYVPLETVQGVNELVLYFIEGSQLRQEIFFIF